MFTDMYNTVVQAKTVSLSGQAKIKLTVDIQGGKFMAIKPTKNVMNDNNVFTHDKSMLLLVRYYIVYRVIFYYDLVL